MQLHNIYRESEKTFREATVIFIRTNTTKPKNNWKQKELNVFFRTEDTVYEVQKAKELGIPIIRRSELLSIIAKSKKTIAVAGTSGKSTTSAMLYQILLDAKLEPSIISGAGLTSIIKEGKIGNAAIGKGEWLIIEADESDGSVVQYEPEIGLLLNIDKDHQEIDELIDLFTIFKNNTKGLFIVNQSNALAKTLSADFQQDFGFEDR